MRVWGPGRNGALWQPSADRKSTAVVRCRGGVACMASGSSRIKAATVCTYVVGAVYIYSERGVLVMWA